MAASLQTSAVCSVRSTSRRLDVTGTPGPRLEQKRGFHDICPGIVAPWLSYE